MKIENRTYSQSNNNTFKWNRATHLEMSMLALKDCKLDSATKRFIARCSQLPDFMKKELGYYNNAHFYYPKSSSKKSFGKNSEQLNAYTMFMNHLKTIFLSKKREEILRHIGYAAHFLQDISTPVHTKEGSFVQKCFDYPLHKSFERGKKHGAKKRTMNMVKNYTPQEIETKSLLDLFKTTAEFSAKPELDVNRFNKEKWPEIQQKCFDFGTSASKIFYETIINKMRPWINL